MFKRSEKNRKTKKTEANIKTSVQVIKGLFTWGMFSELFETEFKSSPTTEIVVIDQDKAPAEVLPMISSLGFDLKKDPSLKSIYICYFNADNGELIKMDCLIADGIEESQFASDLSEKGIMRFTNE
jgi:hypothetical protein